MLTEIYVPFPTAGLAGVALTKMRKRYHVALRGSVASRAYRSDGKACYRLFVNLSASGFSAGEFTEAIKQFNLHTEVK